MSADVKPLRFALVYLGTIIGLMALSYVLEVLIQFSLPSGVSTVLPAIIGGMSEGTRIAKATGQPYDGKAAWAGARKLTLVMLAINALLIPVVFFIPQADEAFAVIGWPVLLAVFAVLLFLSFLMVRLGIRLGSRTQMNQMTRDES